MAAPSARAIVMPKILWIKNKEPEVYARTHKFLTGSSYIAANAHRTLCRRQIPRPGELQSPL